MIIIGENIHIISKNTKQAIEARDEGYILNLIEGQKKNADVIDFNIGPARHGYEGTMSWLCSVATKAGVESISFDTTNAKEIEAGLKSASNPEKCFINSTNGSDEKLDVLAPLAQKYGANLIALTMINNIPKEADERLEIAFNIIEKTTELGIENGKIFFDPLVLPVNVDQEQVMEAISAIRMFKESFDPQVFTTVGLSNISNGSPNTLRPLLNRVFAVLAMGAGLDSAIADAFDNELARVIKMIKNNSPETSSDKLLVDLFNMIKDFGELEDISYEKSDKISVKIYKTAEVLLNKKIYSHSYLDV